MRRLSQAEHRLFGHEVKVGAADSVPFVSTLGILLVVVGFGLKLGGSGYGAAEDEAGSGNRNGRRDEEARGR